MSLIISHPTGNANLRAVAQGFAEAGLLECFFTSIAAFSGDMLYSLGGIGLFQELRKRSFDPILRQTTKMYPWSEFGRILSSKIGRKNWIAHETGRFCIDRVYQDLDQKVAKNLKLSKTKAIYAYEDGALASFIQARSNGINCLYDLPIGYWRTARKLMQSELENRPDWAITLGGFRDSELKLVRKDQELALADHIFVASSFTAKSLEDYPGKLAPISVIPYGFPDVFHEREYSSCEKRKLKILFVGGLSQRKGIANLLEAVEGLEEYVEFTIIGRKPTEECIPLNKGLAKHKWISALPHDQVIALMRSQDVFVFPSLFEGFGLVITEAMSQGTPVITTDRTCGVDLIRHDENGWLVEAGSTTSLRQQIEGIIMEPSKIARVGRAAIETASLRPWSIYGKEMARAVKDILNKA